MKRVVVTGMGIVSPVGTGIENAWKNIITLKPSNMTLFLANNYYILNNFIYMVIAIIGMFPFINNCMNKLSNKKNMGYLYDIWLIIVFVVSIIFLIQSTYNPFIYFRF